MQYLHQRKTTKRILELRRNRQVSQFVTVLKSRIHNNNNIVFHFKNLGLSVKNQSRLITSKSRNPKRTKKIRSKKWIPRMMMKTVAKNQIPMTTTLLHPTTRISKVPSLFEPRHRGPKRRNSSSRLHTKLMTKSLKFFPRLPEQTKL